MKAYVPHSISGLNIMRNLKTIARGQKRKASQIPVCGGGRFISNNEKDCIN